MTTDVAEYRNTLSTLRMRARALRIVIFADETARAHCELTLFKA
jgi:hypothetical protein